MFALTQMKSFWFRFFQKANGVKRGSAPENGAFLFAKLFLLRFWCQKKKRKNDGDVVMIQRRMYEKSNFSCHPERSEAESNFFRLRSQMSLRSICSSLRSEFDCAQDDVDEKSAEQSKAGSTNNQRTMYAQIV